MNKEQEDLFKQLENIVVKGEEDELNYFLDAHQDLLKIDPIRFIGDHVQFYALKDDVNNALLTVEHYKNAPYISMKVEDFLNELKTSLTKINKKPEQQYSIEKLKEYLFSDNENKVSSALNYLSKQNIRNFLTLIREYLAMNLTYKYKTLVLFMLIEQKVDEEFSVNKNGIIYHLNPSFLTLPFDEYNYADAKNFLLKQNINESLKDISLELLNTSQIKAFPDSFLDDDNVELIVDIIITIACDMLGEEYNLNDYLKKYNINKEIFISLKEEINNTINS